MAQDNLQNSNNRGEGGNYQPKYPETRPLLHEEMDYNLDLIGQVIKGYRVMGSGPAGELDLSADAGKVLKLYKVTGDDTALIDAGAKIGDYVWVPSTVESGGSDAVTLDDITANIEAGAINIGDTVPAGSTLQDVVEQLLLTTYNPTFNNPSFSLGDNVANLQEIGNIIDINLTFNFNRGTIKGDLVGGTWDPNATQNPRAGVANTYTINGVTQAGNTLQITDHLVVEGDNTFQGNVAYLEGPQPLDSNGNDYSSPLPAGTSPNRSTSFEGVYPYFYGTSNNYISDPNNVATLIANGGGQKVLANANGTLTLNVGTSLTHIWLAIPSNYSLKNQWYETVTNFGPIAAVGTTPTTGGDLFIPYTEIQVSSPESYWSDIEYTIYLQKPSASGQGTIFTTGLLQFKIN